jgi:2-polyprenyl-6-methoxyphenol hydroxylase-like FAD-dependent oxidoreductase
MKPVTIIGGGLAGLSLGIGLRQKSVPVTVIEAGKYPRHKVCGEFISGRGRQTLRRLGLSQRLMDVIEARTVSFVVPGTRSRRLRLLGEPALCLSRFKLDRLLAEIFGESGGELRESTRWRDGAASEGEVRATGRRPQARENGWRWYGLKIHARNLSLSADLEMHVVPNGYVGLCRLPEGEVNICGLFRSSSGNSVGARTGKGTLLPLLGLAGSPLHERLRGVDLEESSFCSVAGLSLRPRRAGEFGECAIGDALTMTPPVTGNGMSMAFESAELAIEPLAAYSRGDLSWEAAQEQVACACDATFRTRLAWAAKLQSMMFSHTLQRLLGPLLVRSGFFWHIMLRKTR